MQRDLHTLLIDLEIGGGENPDSISKDTESKFFMGSLNVGVDSNPKCKKFSGRKGESGLKPTPILPFPTSILGQIPPFWHLRLASHGSAETQKCSCHEHLKLLQNASIQRKTDYFCHRHIVMAETLHNASKLLFHFTRISPGIV